MQKTATITQGQEIVTLINTFTVEPERQQAVIDSLTAATERTMRHLPGFIAASVHRSLDGRHVVNYAQWDTEEHFRAMFADPDAAAHMNEVAGLALSVTPVLYTVAYVGAGGA